jgi:hypothetical protein
MAKIKLTCPDCGQSFDCSTRYRGKQIGCPSCKHLVPLPRRRKFLIPVLAAAVVLFLIACVWVDWPMGVHWQDRRPIGMLFLASDGHVSATNPRGWFNDESLDVVGKGGQERFKKELLEYADTSITNLQRLGAQGVIVWDVEGEQFPHKTSFIGDPRLTSWMAPEMAPVVNEFFKKFRDAGLKVGVTIRPQQIVFDNGLPRQATALDISEVLREKIDFARTNWGATMFYIDSNDGLWRPDEVLQLRLLARERPDVLLIPEHHALPYWAFSTPYVSLHRGNGDWSTDLARRLFPSAFQVLDISDASNDAVVAAWRRGDILLFRAWYWNDDCDLVQSFEHNNKP